MRVVHFSDIHLGCWSRAFSSLFDKRLLGQANYVLRRRHQIHTEYLTRALMRVKMLAPELVICTGDLTCVSSPEEFALARQALEELFHGTSLEFIVVPGNHDAYVRNRACAEALDMTVRSLNRGGPALGDLPVCIDRKGLRFILVNEACPTSWVSSAGCVGEQSLDLISGWLDAPRGEKEKRVLVGHFPLLDSEGRPLSWRRRLRNSDVLRDALLDGRIDVSLCGHIHAPFRRDEACGSMEICAGSVTVNGLINVLDYSPHSGKFTQHWEDVSSSRPVKVKVSEQLVPASAVD